MVAQSIFTALVGAAFLASKTNAVIDPEFYAEPWEAVCATGKLQTPINLPKDYSTLPPVPSTHITNLEFPVTKNPEVVNKGTAVQVEWDPKTSFDLTGGTSMPVLAAGGASVSDALLNLETEAGLELPMVPLQYHVHTPSEHAIGGYLAAAELHIVTAVAPGFAPDEWGCDALWEGGDIVLEKCVAVFGVLYIFGDDAAVSPPVFDKILSKLNLTDGSHTPFPDKDFDLATLLPEDKSYYSYIGSLTTPPCSEGVRWHVFKEPVVISTSTEYALESALAHFKEGNQINYYRHNNRPIQPTNNRTIWFHADGNTASGEASDGEVLVSAAPAATALLPAIALAAAALVFV